MSLETVVSGSSDGTHDSHSSKSPVVPRNPKCLEPESTPRRILMVEDNPGDAELCRLYLEEGFGPGIDIVHATELHQALAVITHQDVDVVLLDLGLPDSVGLETVVAVQRAAPDLPIVVMTGNQDSQLGVQVIREHAQDCCAKQSLNASLLLQSIRHAIERQRLLTQYHRLLETSPDGIVVVDGDNRMLFVNRQACKMLERDPSACVGETLPSDLRAADTDEVRLSSHRVAEVRSVPVDWNHIPATLISYRDITARKRAESRLKHLVQYDQLTGLASRTYFFDQMTRMVSGVRRNGGSFALMFMDLDGFKVINDSMGHDTGDEVLCKVSKRISANIRTGDFLARLGGDEFALVLPNVKNPEEVAHVAEKLLAGFEQPLDLSGLKVGLGLSIGVAICPQSGVEVQSLYQAADMAMYRAKEQGKNCYRFFAEDMQHQVEMRIRMEQAVRQVTADNSLWLAYQPQVRAADGFPLGFEALLRWPTDTGVAFSPADFVPVMEELGLIERVGSAVLLTAATMAAKAGGEYNLPLRVAVNVAVRQLYDKNLLSVVEQVLTSTGLAAGLLALEITESSVMGDPARAERTLRALRELGVSVVIDDFGTGYSSLSYLRRLPVDALKIDRSFVIDINCNAETEAILLSLINLAHALGLQVTAEGVETAEQQAFLVDSGCDCLQGYYIHRPDTEQQISNWLRDSRIAAPGR